MSPLSKIEIKQRIMRMHQKSRSILFDYNIPEFFTGSSISDWLVFLSKKGVPIELLKKIVCNQFSIPIKQAKKCVDKQGLWLEEGFYCYTSDTFYLWDFDDEAIDSEGFGLLLGSKAYGRESFSSEVDQNVLSLFAKMEMSRFSSRGIVDVHIKDKFLYGVTGRNYRPLERVGLSTLSTRDARYTKASLVNDVWGFSVRKFVNHIESSFSGKLSFMCGDYILDLPEKIRNEVHRGTPKTAVVEEFLSADFTQSDVYIIELDKIKRITHEERSDFIDRINLSNAHFVFVSSARNISHLLAKVSVLIDNKTLAHQWGVHSFRVSIPKLCPNCKSVAHKERSYSDEAVNVSVQISSAYEVGLGCSKCVDGYQGMVFASEDVSGEKGFRMLLSDKVSLDDTDEDKMSSHELQPFSVANALYKKDDMQSLRQSLSQLLTDGIVSPEDVKGLLS
jgi:hypothetical protein